MRVRRLGLVVHIGPIQMINTGLNLKVFQPLAHRAGASPVSLARMQNVLARNISDIQVIIYKMTHQKFR